MSKNFELLSVSKVTNFDVILSAFKKIPLFDLDDASLIQCNFINGYSVFHEITVVRNVLPSACIFVPACVDYMPMVNVDILGLRLFTRSRLLFFRVCTEGGAEYLSDTDVGWLNLSSVCYPVSFQDLSPLIVESDFALFFEQGSPPPSWFIFRSRALSPSCFTFKLLIESWCPVSSPHIPKITFSRRFTRVCSGSFSGLDVSEMILSSRVGTKNCVSRLYRSRSSSNCKLFNYSDVVKIEMGNVGGFSYVDEVLFEFPGANISRCKRVCCSRTSGLGPLVVEMGKHLRRSCDDSARYFASTSKKMSIKRMCFRVYEDIVVVTFPPLSLELLFPMMSHLDCSVRRSILLAVEFFLHGSVSVVNSVPRLFPCDVCECDFNFLDMCSKLISFPFLYCDSKIWCSVCFGYVDYCSLFSLRAMKS